MDETIREGIRDKIEEGMKQSQEFVSSLIPSLVLFLIFVSSLIPLFSSLAFAGIFGKSPGEAGFPFLKIPMSARAAGMGEAFTGIPNDAQGFEYNPASPGTLRVRELWFSHLSYFENINMESAHFAWPEKWGAFALHFRYLSSNDTFRDRVGIESGEFKNEDFLISVGHSFRVTSSLFVGFGVKYLSERLGEAQARLAAMDVGAMYQFPKAPVAVGFSLQNIGNDASFESLKQSLPLTLRLGGSYRIGLRMLASVETVQSLDQELQLRAGLEYYLSSLFVLRTGYKLDRKKLEDFNGVTAGIGFARAPLFIDYAFLPSNDLGLTHRVSIGLKWYGVSLGKKQRVDEVLKRVEEVKQEQKAAEEEKLQELRATTTASIKIETAAPAETVQPKIGSEEFVKVPELPDLHFEFDSTAFDEASMEALPQEVEYLKKNADLEILIEGHCDDRGTREYNNLLGQDRAQFLKKLYTALGLSGERILTASYGKDQLLCLVPTEECRAQNRRVEVKVRRKAR